jgi:hypothetical protein
MKRLHMPGTRRSSLVVAGAVVGIAVVVTVVLLVAPSPSTGPVQYGINIYVADNCVSPAVWQAAADNQMESIRSLGANSVAIAFPFYTTGLTSNRIFAANRCHGSVDPDPGLDPQSPSAARLAVLVRAAQTHHLFVLLRPELNEDILRPKWRGAIAPTNRSAWFASYDQMMKPYLQMAQQYKVTRFDIAVELASLGDSKHWASTIAFAKNFYGFNLVFDADWVGPGRGSVGLVPHPHTTFAVDAYPKVPKSTPSGSVAQLLAAWDGSLSDQSFPIPDSDITIDEAGINSVDGAYINPSTFAAGKFNPTIQANWFTAACDFMKEHQFAGIYFWGPQFSFNFGKLLTVPQPTQPTELQPETQAAIRACFK